MDTKMEKFWTHQIGSVSEAKYFAVEMHLFPDGDFFHVLETLKIKKDSLLLMRQSPECMAQYLEYSRGPVNVY